MNNACDAMPEGGAIRLETRLEREPAGEEVVVVSVSDTGIGIPPERQAHIFEPFFTTKDLKQGTGLGLSIAARIVREHKGTIELKSAPGAGTTFAIRFPAAVPSSVASLKER
jgi:signal transduction histidine kinase